MQRKRDSVAPIGNLFSELEDGPVETLRQPSPQALHHFTQADQVNQLVGASEADTNLGFIARLMALCSLPRTNPSRPPSIQARQRSLHAHRDSDRKRQAPLRQPAPPVDGLALDRSGTHSKPRDRSRPLTIGVHAVTRNQQRQRRRSGGANPAPQPDEPAVCVAPSR